MEAGRRRADRPIAEIATLKLSLILNGKVHFGQKSLPQARILF
jgi:hypothetical protein